MPPAHGVYKIDPSTLTSNGAFHFVKSSQKLIRGVDKTFEGCGESGLVHTSSHSSLWIFILFLFSTTTKGEGVETNRTFQKFPEIF